MINIALVALYLFCFFAILAFVFILETFRKKNQKSKEKYQQLSDILTTAPLGFFSYKNGRYYANRRLCILLNLFSESTPFDKLLTCFSEESQENLTDAVLQLQQNQKPFELTLQDIHKFKSFKIIGVNTDEENGYLLWVLDISLWQEEINENKKKNNQLLLENHCLTEALKVLPVPLKIQTKNFIFENKEGIENMEKITESFSGAGTISYSLDTTKEENFFAQLQQNTILHKMVLKELSTPVCIFNANAQLIFANKAFQHLLQIEAYQIKKMPLFEDVLNIMQEKNLLPPMPDFSQYKEKQKQLFAQLTRPVEDFLYLSNAHIIRRVMIPAEKGGVLLFFEDKTGFNQ